MLKKIHSWTLIIVLLSMLLMFAQGLHAQVDPNIEWKEIETEDAYWLYDAKHQDLVEYYIWQFDQAKEPLLKLFKESPRKMTIVIMDFTDQANGSAQVTPHPYIRLFPVLPSSSSSIGEFSDSVYEILGHEYTHILNMDPVHGWITPLYWIFGSIAHPNMVLPRWYTEGLAVYTESKYSETGGRLNSQFVEGIARSLTLENRWTDYPLSQLNDHHFDWLGASRAYIFGGILWDSIARDGKESIIYDLNQSYSRRVPYFLEGVLRDKLGRSYEEQLERAYNYWDTQALRQIEKVSSQPNLSGPVLRQEKNTFDVSPSISPDGEWMVFLSDSNNGRGDISIVLRHPKKSFLGYKPIHVESNTRAQTVAWHPAATGFVYEKLDLYDFYYQFYDLYFYDLKTRKSERLTKGMRAHHPCYSPDGKKIYFLQNIPGTKQITSLDIQSKKTEVLYTGKLGDDLKFLSCPSKDTILVVEQKPKKVATIQQIDLVKKQKTTFFNKYPVNYMKWSSKGLIFSSNFSGIENLYLMETPNDKDKPRAITNTKTRVTQGDIDPLVDELYYSQFTADGPKVFVLKGAQWESFPDIPPQVPPIVDYRQKTSSANQSAVENATEANLAPEVSTISKAPEDNPNPKHEVSSFSPWRYLYPNHWIPFLYIVDRGTLFQASTSAGDPLGKNIYNIVGQWDTLTKKPGVSFSYFNSSTPITLGFGLSDVHTYFYSTGTTLHFSNYTGLASWRLWFEKRINLIFKWNYSQLNFTTNQLTRQGPQVQLSYTGAKQKGNEISASSGWNAQLGHKEYLSDMGNISYGETYGHLGTYWSSFVPSGHAFHLAFNGAYAPQLNNTFFATSTLAGPFLNLNTANTSFLQRGYPTGFLVAKNILNTNAEYRFPLFSVFRGWTGPPVFLKNLHGSLVFDATTIDGRYSSSQTGQLESAHFGHRWFTGYGLELNSNMNVGFHIPITLTLGLYYGEDPNSFGGFTTFFNVRL